MFAEDCDFGLLFLGFLVCGLRICHFFFFFLLLHMIISHFLTLLYLAFDGSNFVCLANFTRELGL